MATPLPPGALSPNFTLAEFTTSRIAAVRGISNQPPPELLPNLQVLARALEEVRALLGGVPITITSGYRSAALNKAVRGSLYSAHTSGLAADFIAPRYGTPLEICRAIQASDLVFYDQLIYEGTWVHLGLAPEGHEQRGNVLTAVFRPGKRTTYATGLPA